jgi:hypothetical protein
MANAAAAKRATEPAPVALAPDPPEAEDLNAAVITLEWNGQTVGTIPKRRGRWPSKAGRLFEEEKYVGALQCLLGGEAYAKLEDEICPFIDDLDEFANHAGTIIQRECIP